MRFIPKPGLLSPGSVRAELVSKLQQAGWRVASPAPDSGLAIDIAEDGVSAVLKNQLRHHLAIKGYHPDGTLTYLPVPVYRPESSWESFW